ncbi:MAG: hypothetical protein IKC03_01105 [Oscillospiraceae bacterium]|nr:hypothetical protein [Oscillospiraceae bacterium]
MIRRFRLTNGEGATWDLNSRASFFHSIAGFGYKDGTQFEQVGSDFLPLEELFAQGEMTGRILFGGLDAYKTYREFSRFLRAVPLILTYQTDETYRVPVRLMQLEKGELMEGGGGLVCDVAFLATGQFYKNVSKQSGTMSIGGKVYPYQYNYSYADLSDNTLVIDSDSYEDSPCRISIFGPCVNPVWMHYVDNVLYATGRYEGTIPTDNRLVIDATEIPYSITERGASGAVVADRYQQCDFNTERFFHLQHGSNRISVTHDGLNVVTMIVEGKISYETV